MGSCEIDWLQVHETARLGDYSLESNGRKRKTYILLGLQISGECSILLADFLAWISYTRHLQHQWLAASSLFVINTSLDCGSISKSLMIL